MAIALPIRQFIKNVMQAETFSAFLNLNTINKYLNLDINWMVTIFCIKDNTASNATNYETSTLLKKKLQRVLEMLPTMETLKK
ncbi:13144_t:CDS:1 [Funneliformis geosporum]|uniref:13144_t:CDS:1 n=1 Tax=Funneliformis geosporum TaxID=1117311 RepID=A0A9W4X4J6_9GLOM|nr:13144_t:CDS:1 [Funneliformis geosporum]